MTNLDSILKSRHPADPEGRDARDAEPRRSGRGGQQRGYDVRGIGQQPDIDDRAVQRVEQRLCLYVRRRA